jgi:hypothetical protein
MPVICINIDTRGNKGDAPLKQTLVAYKVVISIIINVPLLRWLMGFLWIVRVSMDILCVLYTIIVGMNSIYFEKTEKYKT